MESSRHVVEGEPGIFPPNLPCCDAARACRYRWRTRLRKVLPLRLAHHIPKGHRDCGNHAWYNSDGIEDRRYHCESESVTVKHEADGQ